MKVRALRELRFKTSKGEITVKPGQVFKPAEPEKLIHAGLVEPVILPPDQVGRPYAAKIFSRILDDIVWIVTSPEAIAFIPAGEIYYLPEEIRNLRGASAEEICQIHMIKKELGGKLIVVNNREGGKS